MQRSTAEADTKTHSRRTEVLTLPKGKTPFAEVGVIADQKVRIPEWITQNATGEGVVRLNNTPSPLRDIKA